MRWIARASLLHLNRDLPSRHFARCFDDFQNGIALSVTQINCGGRIARAQVIERKRVRLRKVANVYVVAHTRSIRRRIVGAKDSDAIDVAACGFEDEWHQVVSGTLSLAW